MKKLKSIIPSFVTSLNMVCGSCASILALQGKIEIAIILVIAAAIFDFCDGFVARLLNSVSELGKQLDSLSDLISFGFAPSAMMYNFVVTNGIFDSNIALFVMLITIFSGFRLAKFNIDPTQTTEFKGMPTPASALFIIPICYYCTKNTNTLTQILSTPVAVIIVTAFLCVMMVTNLPLMSLKIKSFKIRAIAWQLVLLAGCILFICIFGVLGISITIIFYIILSGIKIIKQNRL